jgi:PIN domain nuclease of toxin-antitoxin system
MAAVIADTHAALWYLLQSPRLSEAALRRMEETVQGGDSILLPSICVVEVIYLVEKGRLPTQAEIGTGHHLMLKWLIQLGCSLTSGSLAWNA